MRGSDLVARGFGKRPGPHHLPRHGDAILGILRQQLVERRAAGARQSHDEYGVPDRHVRHFRVPFARFDQMEAVLENPERVALRDDAADQRQLRLLLVRPEEPLQRLAKGLVAEIREPRIPGRPTEEPAFIEPRGGTRPPPAAGGRRRSRPSPTSCAGADNGSPSRAPRLIAPARRAPPRCNGHGSSHSDPAALRRGVRNHTTAAVSPRLVRFRTGGSIPS